MFITWSKLVRPQNRQDMIMTDQGGLENLAWKSTAQYWDKVEKYGKVLVEILKCSLFYTS